MKTRLLIVVAMVLTGCSSHYQPILDTRKSSRKVYVIVAANDVPVQVTSYPLVIKQPRPHLFGLPVGVASIRREDERRARLAFDRNNLLSAVLAPHRVDKLMFDSIPTSGGGAAWQLTNVELTPVNQNKRQSTAEVFEGTDADIVVFVTGQFTLSFDAGAVFASLKQTVFHREDVLSDPESDPANTRTLYYIGQRQGAPLRVRGYDFIPRLIGAVDFYSDQDVIQAWQPSTLAKELNQATQHFSIMLAHDWNDDGSEDLVPGKMQPLPGINLETTTPQSASAIEIGWQDGNTLYRMFDGTLISKPNP